MSNPSSPESQNPSPVPPNSPPGPEIHPPPISLPPPDVFDTRKSNQGRNTFEKRQKARRGKRRHPLDPYRDHRKKPWMRGCCVGMFCLILFFAVLTAGLASYAGQALLVPLREKHRVERLHGAEETVAEAPAAPTLYVAPNSRVIYRAPATAVAVSIVAREIEISGTFSGPVILRALKTRCRAGSRFEQDLDILTVQFQDEGMVVKGVLKGKTIQ